MAVILPVGWKKKIFNAYTLGNTRQLQDAWFEVFKININPDPNSYDEVGNYIGKYADGLVITKRKELLQITRDLIKQKTESVKLPT